MSLITVVKTILSLAVLGLNNQALSSGENTEQNQQATVPAQSEQERQEALTWQAFQNLCNNNYTWEDFIPYLKQYLPENKRHLSSFADIVKEKPIAVTPKNGLKMHELYCIYLLCGLGAKQMFGEFNVLFVDSKISHYVSNLINFIQVNSDAKQWLEMDPVRLEMLANILVMSAILFEEILNNETIDKLYKISGLTEQIKKSIGEFYIQKSNIFFGPNIFKSLRIYFLTEYLYCIKYNLYSDGWYNIKLSHLIEKPNTHKHILGFILSLINDISDWNNIIINIKSYENKKNISSSDEAKRIAEFIMKGIDVYRDKISKKDMLLVYFALKANKDKHFIARYNSAEYENLMNKIQSYLHSTENIGLTPELYMQQHDNGDTRRTDRLDTVKHFRQSASLFPLKDRTIQPEPANDFRELNVQQADLSHDTNIAYQLAKSKFAYANLLDFAGISKLKIKQPVNVYVSEISGVKSLGVLKIVNADKANKFIDDHGTGVASVIRAIVPSALLVGGKRNHEQEKKYHIINLSWGMRESAKTEDLLAEVTPRLQLTNTLFVWASGNLSQRGMAPSTIITKSVESKAIYEVLTKDVADADKQRFFDENLKNMLWVTSVTGYSSPSDFATRPGVEFKDHTLSALGTDVMVLNNDNKLTYVDGTSFAAPTVTGVAALLKEEYFDMTPFDIKTCLLESADKEIFANYGDVPGEKLPNGKVRLDPTVYGKGILNAPHAMLYAKILRAMRQMKNNPDLAPNDPSVIAEYQKAVSQEEAKAAQKILKLKGLRAERKPSNVEPLKSCSKSSH